MWAVIEKKENRLKQKNQDKRGQEMVSSEPQYSSRSVILSVCERTATKIPTEKQKGEEEEEV